MELLATISHEQSDEVDTGALIGGSGRESGEVALVFPLSAFDIVNVSVPPVGRESVGRVLPFTLSKVLQSPIQDYIYDWQVAQTFKDRQELAVYLFPVSLFNRIQQDLLSRQKEITWFEPDVFAASSYLELTSHPALERTALVLLVWEDSVSISVYENETITLVRSVDMVLPSGSPGQEAIDREQQRKEVEALQEAEEKAKRENDGYELILDVEPSAATEMSDTLEIQADPFHSEKSDTILAGFDLFQQEQDTVTAAAHKDEAPESSLISTPTIPEQKSYDTWLKYIQNLVLEIVRTSDYHRSVLKGNRVTDVIVGGAQGFYNELEEAIREGHPIELHPFPAGEIEAECKAEMAAMAIGAMNR